MTLTSSVPVLRVSNYEIARTFWHDVLGFDIAEEAGEPTGFGIFRSGAAQVFIIAYQGAEAAYDGWRAYFHTGDLDAVAGRLSAAGHAFKGPAVTEYGMREIEVTDPDGNVLCFGQDAP